MEKRRKKRVAVRLTATMYHDIKLESHIMSKEIDGRFRQLVHDLQMGRITRTTRERLYHQQREDDSTIACNFGLDAAAIDYLQLNGYNVTTCVKYAITFYCGKL